MKKMARAMAALKVDKIVVNSTEPEARLQYRLLTMLVGQAVPPIEAWPLLRVEPMSYLRPEVWKVATRWLLVAVMNLCQEHRDAHRGKPLSKMDKQIGKREEHRPKARMDHCALMEVLYYALCGIPGGSRGELTEYPTMIRVMEGHEVFGPLQLRRIDWQQEMFREEEELEHVETGPDTGKASSSGQPMEVDEERKGAVTEPVAVDATKVEAEKEEEETSSWADVEEDAPLCVKRSR